MSFPIEGWLVDFGGSEWTLKVTCGVHNHPPGEYLESHLYMERLSESETSIIIEMSKCHMYPRDILTLLKQKNLMNVSTMKTLYNAHHKYRVIKHVRSQLQHLLYIVSESNYIGWHHRNEHNNSCWGRTITCISRRYVHSCYAI